MRQDNSADEHNWTFENHPREQDIQFLRDQIYQYNITATGIFDGEELAMYLRDDGNRIVAGIYGWTWGECLFIQYLWVRDDMRGKGFGKTLLTAAEQEAVLRGCRQALLDTHSFQAPGFYQKFGYEIVSVVEDYPRQHQDLRMRKSLTQGSSS